ncbi:MAG: addiction module protein [Thermodesulfovibrionales bacterium]|nr:addiction module protein [Nitrospinota bacterium]MCG2710469.1 addiction module protein [Thermodesulfovibrionales bacterium]
MSALMQEVINKAFNLSPEERAELAHELIISIDDAIDNEVETAWDAEIERRVKEIESGKAKGRQAEDILAEILSRQNRNAYFFSFKYSLAFTNISMHFLS